MPLSELLKSDSWVLADILISSCEGFYDILSISHDII